MRQRVHPQEGYLGRQRDPLPTRVDGLPALPLDYTRVVDAGVRDLELTLRPEQRRAIDDHVRLLLAWTTAINLTAIRDPAAIGRLHVLDSLAAVPLFRSLGIRRLVDLGSGGGFPGLPLAIALDAEARLVDSVGKKASFLETAARALGLDRVTAVASRAETLAADPAERESWPAVVARAVAPLAELVELAFPLLAPGGVLVAWKRGELDSELQAARLAVAELGGGSLALQDPGLVELPGHRLVLIRKTGQTGKIWPRDPAARRRRPW